MKVFVSAVSSEFGTVRARIASDLRARGLTVKFQEDFTQRGGATTTLQALHNYIEECETVICIVGSQHGACPPAVAAAPFKGLLPNGIETASYTHWELFFALQFKKRLSLHIAQPDYLPEKASVGNEDPGLQSAFVRHIKGQGLNREYFAGPFQSIRQSYRMNHPGKCRPTPLP